MTLDPAAFGRAGAKSIDYAVMERTTRAAVTPVAYGTVRRRIVAGGMGKALKRDAEENAAQGSAVFVNSRGSYVASEKQLVALLGLENVVVVATDDAILVARREDSEGLRRVVDKLKQVAPTLTENHLKVHRPWGSYQSVDKGDRFQVKRIVVKQGGRLSLQVHHHRAEHWIVVRGTARVTIGDQVKLLYENKSIWTSFPAVRGTALEKTRQDRSGVDRSTDRKLFGRRRYCAHRRRLSSIINPSGGRRNVFAVLTPWNLHGALMPATIGYLAPACT